MPDQLAPIRGILFDIDGTLFDTPASMLAAARASLIDDVPDERAGVGAAMWLADEQRRYEAYLAGQLTFVEQRTMRVGDVFRGLGLAEPDVERSARWLANYREAQLRTTIAFDDVTDCLRACAGLAMGAVTNNDGEWQRTRIKHAGLDEWIGPVLGIDDVGAPKPDPRIFHAGCAALGLEPAQVAYVGDDLRLDAHAAAAAGLYGIWLDRLGAGPAPEDVARITTLREVPECVARFGSRPGVR
ncbi:MAG TPA: HAD family hydrolase [Mycobacteriales bacterium]|nr:HAD family hydrolase [Mycobacteriales bacterium]